MTRAISSATSSGVPSDSQQDGLGIQVVTGLDEGFDAAVAGLSIISSPAGMMPAAMIAATASPALADIVERGHHHLPSSAGTSGR